MASEYVITFRGTDTALTPGFVLFQRLADGGTPSLPAPAITAVGYGLYKFAYTAQEDVVFVIDGNVGGGSVPETDRWVRGVLSPADAMLDTSISSRSSAQDLNSLRADYTTARASKLDNLDAPVSGAAQASDLQGLQEDLARILDHQEGKWEIAVTGPWANHLVLYKRDGSVLKRFALYGVAGEPTYLNPFARDPVADDPEPL